VRALAVAIALALALLAAGSTGEALAATGAAAPSDAADPARGRKIVVDRHLGMCLMCHSGPFPEVASQGDLASNLRGAGARWTNAQLRARIVDARRLDPETLMPAYGRSVGLSRVAPEFRGQPILTPRQIDDVVAFLATLRD
jgi:sulfur-oxidizing protein SoxX